MLATALQRVLNLHREEFPPAQRPIAPPVVPVGEEAVRARHRAEALRGIGVFARAARAEAKARALKTATTEILDVQSAREQARTARQRDLDAWWDALRRNDPDTLLAALADAFEDNEAAAAPVGVSGDRATVVVLVPGPEVLPERHPTTTPAGNLSLKRLTKAESSSLYLEMLAGFVLVTVKEAFAVAPGLASVQVVAVRRAAPDAFGKRPMDVVAAARFDRDVLGRVLWKSTPATRILTDAGDELMLSYKGRPPAVQPLDLAHEPDLRAVLDLIEHEPGTH